MIDYPSRPSAANLQQRPVTVGAAAQHMILGTLAGLVRENVFSEDRALAILMGLRRSQRATTMPLRSA